MREFGPMLVRTSPVTAPGAVAGSTSAMDFNFGTLTGARIYEVVYGGASQLPPTTGGNAAALNYNSDAPAPAAINDPVESENVFAVHTLDYQLTTSGMALSVQDRWFPPGGDKVPFVIARNIAFQQFTITANAGVGVRVWFRFLTFTEQEIGGLIAFRR